MRVRAGLPAPSRPPLPEGSLMRPRRARAVRRSASSKAPEGMDPAEEIRLCRRWLNASDASALMALVEAHLGLVQRIANEFRHSGPEREDLVQEGHLGL